MKCLLSSFLFSSQLQISTHLLFVRTVNLHILNAMCLKSSNQPRLSKIKWVFFASDMYEAGDLALLINMLSTNQADCFQVMAKKCHTINSMVAHCFMMLLLILFGLRIKSLLELVKPWWSKDALNNVYGNWLLLKFTICIVTMGLSMLTSLWKIARTSSRLSHFLEMVLIIKMPLLSGQSKPLCTWLGPFWFMFLYIKASMVLAILHF